MAVVSGVHHNEHLRPLYARLLARGKPKKLAMVACMRKLLIYLNSLIRTEFPEETAAGRGAERVHRDRFTD